MRVIAAMFIGVGLGIVVGAVAASGRGCDQDGVALVDAVDHLQRSVDRLADIAPAPIPVYCYSPDGNHTFPVYRAPR